MSVSVLGWTLRATQALMIALSGYMHKAPMAPVNVNRPVWAGAVGPETSPAELIDVRGVSPSLARDRAACRKIDGLGTVQKRDIVAYGHPGSQGADRSTAGAA